MPVIAVKPKLASGLPEKLIDDRVIAVAHLVADLHQENVAANDELTSGPLHDSETGLIYNGANYYDPKTGRWTSPDRKSVAEHFESWRARMGVPGEPPLEANPYVRVLNNPLRWIDPTGEAASNSGARPSVSARGLNGRSSPIGGRPQISVNARNKSLLGLIELLEPPEQPEGCVYRPELSCPPPDPGVCYAYPQHEATSGELKPLTCLAPKIVWKCR